MKITLKIFISFIILFTSFASCGTRNLSFARRGCLAEENPYGPPKAGVISKRWHKNRLIVRCFVKTYCGGAAIKGSYLLEDDTVLLQYGIKKSFAITRCMCAHEVMYTIKDIPRKDYNIKIMKK